MAWGPWAATVWPSTRRGRKADARGGMPADPAGAERSPSSPGPGASPTDGTAARRRRHPVGAVRPGHSRPAPAASSPTLRQASGRLRPRDEGGGCRPARAARPGPLVSLADGRCPTAERERVLLDLVRDTSPGSSATRHRAVGPGRLPRPRLRLAHRGRTAQPAWRGHRAAPAGDARLRPPDPGRAGRRLRAACARTPRRAIGAPPSRRARRPPDEPIAIVGDGLPLPRRGAAPRRPVAAARSTAGTRSAAFPTTAAGTSTALYDPDPEHAGYELCHRGRVPPPGMAGFNPRALRDIAA